MWCLLNFRTHTFSCWDDTECLTQTILSLVETRGLTLEELEVVYCVDPDDRMGAREWLAKN